MKKLIFIMFCAVVLTAGAFAEDGVTIPDQGSSGAPAADTQSNAGTQSFRLTLDVDFTTVGMKQANDAMSDDTYVTGYGVGFSGILDLGIAVYPNLLLGTRIGYLFCLPASFEHDYTLPTIHTKTKQDASIIPVELGARLRFQIPFTTAGISVGAFGGVCFAHVANSVDVTNPSSQKANYVEAYDGFGFSGELNAAVEIKLMKGVDFSVNGGYRLAGVPSVKQSADAYYTFSGDSPVLVSNKDSLMRNASNVIVPFDFSGLNVGVGISLGF